ncbi:CDC45 family [Pelagophyceae sp. CCMP2097]|nr:CDC45 family [Pelagophyceae sp. CCMP2097]|mmetsp:Transcript_26472/g.91115  ORF Transcript_26472/g.91115 Transcript_26472/m.91115 type:complete len:609 (+) Transcript_26472:75-1901(+)
MLIDRERFDDVYEAIKEKAVEGGACSVLILVAPDCDALCACQIITSMLKNDNVTFKVQPVGGYTEVAEVGESLSETVRSVVMLNCGACVDLTSIFADCAATIFVVDNHRPIHLRNVHAPNGRVVVLDAEPQDDIPSDGEDLSGDFESDDDDKSENDHDSDDSDDEDAPGGDGENDENRDGNAESGEPAQKKRRTRVVSGQVDDETKARRGQLRAYYDGNYDASPSAVLLFSMCERLCRAGATECWLASLGLTSMHGQWRLDDEKYDGFARYLAERLRHYDAVPVSGDSARVEFDDEELKFMLHRHWSLFDAMYYSNYVASRLSVWKADGRQRLQELLAKMGLSLEHCRQKYMFLAPQQRRALHAALKKYGPAYKLQEPFHACFRRTSAKCGLTLSAADAALVVEACLEAGGGGRAPPAARGVTAIVEPTAWTAGFWEAYDALLPDEETAAVRAAIEAACALQKGVVTHAVSLIERRAITCLKHFRYAYVSAATLGSDAAAFVQPLALRKLALFLVGVHRESGRWPAADGRPLVILAERGADSYLVVGVSPPCGADSTRRRHRLGAHFRLAADHIKASFRQDWFDTAVIELDRDNVQRFIESLHYVLNA